MSEDVRIHDNAAESRFEILLDGEVVGFTEYVRRDGRTELMHTEIGDQYGGRGLASKLIRFALDTTRERGEDVMPYCPFVRKYIAGHQDYLDLVPVEHRDKFGLAAPSPTGSDRDQ